MTTTDKSKSTSTPDIHKCFLGLSKAQVAELNARQDRNTAAREKSWKNTSSEIKYEVHDNNVAIIGPDGSLIIPKAVRDSFAYLNRQQLHYSLAFEYIELLKQTFKSVYRQDTSKFKDAAVSMNKLLDVLEKEVPRHRHEPYTDALYNFIFANQC